MRRGKCIPFRVNLPLAYCSAVALLVLSGLGYRILATRLEVVTDRPVKLSVPLSMIPESIGNWEGKDVPISENIQQVAGNDDFLNRLYENQVTDQWANVYIAYTARPSTMLGHRPQVCYPANGWIRDNTEKSEVTSYAGTKIPCLIHRFHTPQPESQQIVVLNFYVVNGKLTTDESVFSGVGWRTPNIAGDPARYAAQIQISSVLENSARKVAEDMTDLFLNYLPDPNGQVAASEYVEYLEQTKSSKENTVSDFNKR